MLEGEVVPVVVPVLASDQLDQVAERIRDAGSVRVQLLIPSGDGPFQARAAFRVLKIMLGSHRASIEVISDDPGVVAAAEQEKLTVIRIGDADDRPAPRTAQRRDTPAINADDEAFLRELDSGARRIPSTASAVAALDDLSDSLRDRGGARRDQRDTTGRRGANRRGGARGGQDRRGAAPLRRDDDDGYDAPQGGKSVRALSVGAATGVRSADGWRTAQAERRQSLPVGAIGLALLAVALIAAAGWLFLSRATIVIAPPNQSENIQQFNSVIFPTSDTPSDSAIQAASLSSTVIVTITGQAQTEVLTPVNSASGVVNLINTIEQRFELPQGTVLIGKNASGEEVRFTLNVPAVVPAAQTVTSQTGKNTTYGQMDVGVTAVAPGSASNVGVNAITQILIPGQQPLISERSNFIISHKAIGGGDEQNIRLVTEADVERVLGQALTELYGAGVQQLSAQIPAGQALDSSTIVPSTADLADPRSYDAPVVSPPVGSPVDAANPTFSIAVGARFFGLSTPSGRAVFDQFHAVARPYMEKNGPACSAGEEASYRVTKWHWDGSKLMIDGEVKCSISGEIAPETLGRIKSAVEGQSRSAAASALDALVAQKLIGSYTLPERETLPQYDFLLDVQVRKPEQ